MCEEKNHNWQLEVGNHAQAILTANQCHVDMYAHTYEHITVNICHYDSAINCAQSQLIRLQVRRKRLIDLCE